MKLFRNVCILHLVLLLIAACGGEAPSAQSPAPDNSQMAPPAAVVDTATVIEADPAQWLSHGRDYGETRYSPLARIHRENVQQLGLAWSFDLDTSRGIEATPLVHNGVMYVTSTWNIVYALHAESGKLLWRHDPQVDRSRAAFLCCGAVNRGVALWGDRVYTGTIDGRLIAIDRNSGEAVWDVSTIDRDWPYTITGAPRIIDGRVIIGNGGAEYGVRGYVSAYDAESGAMVWRFHTVPGNPELGAESDAMTMAAKTWTGQWWELGGGGTVWDSMAYDPQLDLLYIGVGNGSPWNQRLRSPDGGDNLFLSSIVALRPATGEYVWHYQTTPGETWDYTATQHIILADLDIDGARRKVLMQAPKNGFFYVLDRASGELLSANNYVPVNWATGIDPESGRPTEVAEARWPGRAPHLQLPGPFGGHNWHPMSFSPQTGLVYIPAQEIPFAYSEEDGFRPVRGQWNTGAELALATLPDDEATFKALRAMVKGRLLAWDPVRQTAAWSVEHDGPWNGGTLATGGGLVFQGTADAHFAAYDASSGERLWDFFTQTGVVAAPVSFELDGRQYVAVAAGWGGGYVLAYGGVLPTGSQPAGRVLVFAPGADGTLPEPEPAAPMAAIAAAPSPAAEAEVLAKGKLLYARRCTVCHGDAAVSPGLLPDLRLSAYLQSPEGWQAVVRRGALSGGGMPDFSDAMDPPGAEAIRQYVLDQVQSGWGPDKYRALSNDLNAGQQSTAAPGDD